MDLLISIASLASLTVIRSPMTVATPSDLDETVDRRTTYGYRVAAAYASWTSAYSGAVWVRAR